MHAMLPQHYEWKTQYYALRAKQSYTSLTVEFRTFRGKKIKIKVYHLSAIHTQFFKVQTWYQESNDMTWALKCYAMLWGIS